MFHPIAKILKTVSPNNINGNNNNTAAHSSNHSSIDT